MGLELQYNLYIGKEFYSKWAKDTDTYWGIDHNLMKQFMGQDFSYYEGFRYVRYDPETGEYIFTCYSGENGEKYAVGREPQEELFRGRLHEDGSWKCITVPENGTSLFLIAMRIIPKWRLSLLHPN